MLLLSRVHKMFTVPPTKNWQCVWDVKERIVASLEVRGIVVLSAVQKAGGWIRDELGLLSSTTVTFLTQVMWGQLWDKICHSYSVPLHFCSACHYPWGKKGHFVHWIYPEGTLRWKQNVLVFLHLYSGIQNNLNFFSCFSPLVEPSAAIWIGNVAWIQHGNPPAICSTLIQCKPQQC